MSVGVQQNLPSFTIAVNALTAANEVDAILLGIITLADGGVNPFAVGTTHLMQTVFELVRSTVEIVVATWTSI